QLEVDLRVDELEREERGVEDERRALAARAAEPREQVREEAENDEDDKERDAREEERASELPRIRGREPHAVRRRQRPVEEELHGASEREEGRQQRPRRELAVHSST